MSTQGASSHPIQAIVVRIQLGRDRKSGTDDPVFLRLTGPCGRDFRLLLAKGRTLHRSEENIFRLGVPEANIDHPDLNDPLPPVQP